MNTPIVSDLVGPSKSAVQLVEESYSLLLECGILLAQFDKISEALHAAGFTAFPITDAISGWDEHGMRNLYSPAGRYFRGCSVDELVGYLKAATVPEPAHLPREASPRPCPSAKVSKAASRSEIGERFHWTCVYCQGQGSADLGPDSRAWHIDHFYAESKGGDWQEDNLVLACATCNLKKSAKLLSDFLAGMRIGLVHA